jgi:F-type H+-transporting ATPase subunit epsilon
MPNHMNLKVLLPYKVFADIKEVSQVVIKTSAGSYGLLPHRLDCVAALVPGILMYETEKEGMKYVAVDEGVMVKAGQQVLVSVRNAVGGTDLGNLGALVETHFNRNDEKEREALTVIARLEKGFVYGFDKFLHH